MPTYGLLVSDHDCQRDSALQSEGDVRVSAESLLLSLLTAVDRQVESPGILRLERRGRGGSRV